MTYRLDHFPGRSFSHAGKEHLYFGGTAYLGLATLPEFKERFIKNVSHYGTDYGASRLSNVQLDVYERTESYLASLAGAEACISLSSGYLAGQFTARFFASPTYRRFYAPGTHTALHLENDKNFTDYTELAEALKQNEAQGNGTAVVFLDSIDFFGKHYPDYKALKGLPLSNTILVVDDSHGLGIIGTQGSGCYPSLIQLGAKEQLVCGSLSKGFGVQGGVVLGNGNILDAMRASAFFGGASPASPAAMATLAESSKILHKQRQILQEHQAIFQEALTPLGSFFSFNNGHPAYSFEDQKLAQHLMRHYLIPTNFKYPSDAESTMSRLVLSAGHYPSDIKKLTQILDEYFN